MISCNLGEVGLIGNKRLIKAELSTLIFGLRHSEVLNNEEIQELVDSALKQDLTMGNDVTDEPVDKLKKILEILEG